MQRLLLTGISILWAASLFALNLTCPWNDVLQESGNQLNVQEEECLEPIVNEDQELRQFSASTQGC